VDEPSEVLRQREARGLAHDITPKRIGGWAAPAPAAAILNSNQYKTSSRLDGTAIMTRYLALRVYTVPEGKLEPLTAGFRDHAHRLFARHGLDGLGYWIVRGSVGEPDKLAYLLAAPSREQYESSWVAFRADPEWQEVRRISERDGRLVAKHEEFELEALDFSAVR